MRKGGARPPWSDRRLVKQPFPYIGVTMADASRFFAQVSRASYQPTELRFEPSSGNQAAELAICDDDARYQPGSVDDVTLKVLGLTRKRRFCRTVAPSQSHNDCAETQQMALFRRNFHDFSRPRCGPTTRILRKSNVAGACFLYGNCPGMARGPGFRRVLRRMS
jgi:hypothetical protein